MVIESGDGLTLSFVTARPEGISGDICFECDQSIIGIGDTPSIPASGLWSSDAGLYD